MQMDWLYNDTEPVLSYKDTCQVYYQCGVFIAYLYMPVHAMHRYGQCWVFAGVAVSLLRAVGIACRPVTCYNAAHCVQKLGQVDRYFSTAGDLVANMGRDQIW